MRSPRRAAAGKRILDGGHAARRRSDDHRRGLFGHASGHRRLGHCTGTGREFRPRRQGRTRPSQARHGGAQGPRGHPGGVVFGGDARADRCARKAAVAASALDVDALVSGRQTAASAGRVGDCAAGDLPPLIYSSAEPDGLASHSGASGPRALRARWWNSAGRGAAPSAGRRVHAAF